MKILNKIARRPSRLIEWSQFWILGVLLFVTLKNIGGYLYFGTPMINASKWILLFTALFSISNLVRRDKLMINLGVLSPLPFIVYAGASLFWSANPWIGELTFSILVYAYILFVCCLSMMKTSKSHFHLYYIVLGVSLIALMAAFFQHYFYPEWFPIEGRSRLSQFSNRAAGFFGIPNSFAGLMLLIWPFAFFGMIFKRFPGPMRILYGLFFVLFITGIIISSSRGGFLGLFLQFLILPLFITPEWKKRIKIFLGEILIGLILLGVLWLGQSTLNSRMLQAIEQGGEPTRPAMFEAAFKMFLDAPILGKGIGSYEYLYPKFRTLSPDILPKYVHNDYLEVLATTGLIGFLLLLIPFAYVLLKSIRRLQKTEFYSLSKEGLAQFDRAKRGRPHRREKDWDITRFEGRVPSERIFLSAVLLAFWGFFAHLLVDFHLQIPVLLFVVAIFFSLLCSIIELPKIEIHRKSYLLKYGFILLPPLVAFSNAALTSSSWMAQHIYFVANEDFGELLADTQHIFREPGELYLVEDQFETAIALNPSHGFAYQGLTSAILARKHTEFEEYEDLAKRALPFAEKSMELAPDHYLSHYNWIRVMSYHDADPQELLDHAEKAVELGPFLPENHTILGYVLLYKVKSKELGLRALERALELDPNYRSAVQLRNQHIE